MINILKRCFFVILFISIFLIKAPSSYASPSQTDFIVPSELNILFNENLTNTISDFTIENKMNVPLILEGIEVTKLSDWELTSDKITYSLNEKTIQLLFENKVIQLGLNQINHLIEEEKTFSIDVKHGVFSYDIPKTEAFQFEIVYRYGKSQFDLTLIEDTKSSTIQLDNGDSYTLPKIDKKGFEFQGWFNQTDNKTYPGLGVFIMPTNNVTLTAKYSPIAYSIEYHLNGGIFSNTPPNTYTIESPSFTIPSPIKEGFVFEGWIVNDTLYNQYEIANGTIGNLQLTAKYRLPQITLLDSYDKNIHETLPINKASDLPNPIKEGYEFNGWYIAQEVNTIPISSFTQLTSNYPWKQSVDGIWSSGNQQINQSTSNMISEVFELDSPQNLSFEWRSNGEANYDYLGYDIYNVESGKYLSNISSPTYKSCLKTLKSKASINFTTETIQLQPGHYQLLFMYGKDGSTSKNEDQGFVRNVSYTSAPYYALSDQYRPENFNQDYILISKWTPKNYSYTINHVSTSGLHLHTDVIVHPYNTNIELFPSNFTGYNSPNSQVVLLKNPDTSVEFIYTPKSYTITYELNGGTLPSNIITSYTIEDPSFMLPIPTKANYRFTGWYNNSSLSGNKIESINGTDQQNLLLYAAWEKMPTYILTYGSTIKNQIPDSATKVVFTDITASQNMTLVDLSQAKDMSVVGWLDNETYYISTQTTNQKVIANENSSQMFYNKQNIQSIDFSNLDTSQAKNLSRFLMKTVLPSVDLSSFDTSKVEDMQYMFRECVNLTSLNLSNFNTTNVKNMQHMFYECSNLKTLDLSSWRTPNLENTANMFAVCESLTNIYLTYFDTSKVADMNNMFYLCRKLEELDLSSFSISQDTNMYSMFSQTNKLQKVTFGSNWRFNNSELFKPSSTWLPGGDGKWYNSNGVGYTPSQLATAFDNNPSLMKGTYYAIKP